MKTPVLPTLKVADDKATQLLQQWAGILNPVLRLVAPTLGETLLSFLPDKHREGERDADDNLLFARTLLKNPTGLEKDKVWGSIPTSTTSPGEPGDLARSDTHLYVCTAKDTWRRVAISTF